MDRRTTSQTEKARYFLEKAKEILKKQSTPQADRAVNHIDQAIAVIGEILEPKETCHIMEVRQHLGKTHPDNYPKN